MLKSTWSFFVMPYDLFWNGEDYEPSDVAGAIAWLYMMITAGVSIFVQVLLFAFSTILLYWLLTFYY